jgi:hypothetical protein
MVGLKKLYQQRKYISINQAKHLHIFDNQYPDKIEPATAHGCLLFIQFYCCTNYILIGTGFLYQAATM